MSNRDPKQSDCDKKDDLAGLSRRDFLRVSGVASGLALTFPVGAGMEESEAKQTKEGKVNIKGPGKTPVTLSINGNSHTAELEPRVTLLDALRDVFDYTGAKRVCDRGTCGACTVLINGKAVYSCSVLAIEAQGEKITTVEGLLQNGQLHPIQTAFIEHDALQCGFCTPGFVVACKALLDKHPKPAPEDVRLGLGGNLCRCGTYVGILNAVLQTANDGGNRHG